jgi:hypothetical protein
VVRDRNGSRSIQAGRRFGHYRKEDVKKQRERHVERDRQLEKVLRAWKRYHEVSYSDLFENMHDHERTHIEITLGFTENLEASPRTINKFLVQVLSEEMHMGDLDVLGMFTSGLVSTSQRNIVSLRLAETASRIMGLGIWGDRHVDLKGDLGIEIGRLMSAGRMTIEGDTLEGLGDQMTGGTIILNGNVIIQPDRSGVFVGAGIGERMTGGSIIINGDVIVSPRWFGLPMNKDGSLHLINEEHVQLNGKIIKKEL